MLAFLATDERRRRQKRDAFARTRVIDGQAARMALGRRARKATGADDAMPGVIEHSNEIAKFPRRLHWSIANAPTQTVGT